MDIWVIVCVVFSNFGFYQGWPVPYEEGLGSYRCWW